MNIAYVANSRFPSEKAQSDQVMAMCRAFAAQGHVVRLFVPDRKPIQQEDPFTYYGVSQTFAFERVPCVDALRWRWLGRVGLWIQTATFVWRLRSRLTEMRPDVIYSRELYVFACLSRLSSHVRYVWEAHSLHASWWAKRIMRSLDRIVTLTNASRECLVQMGIDPLRVLVEPDAVDLERFACLPSRDEARACFGMSPEAFVCAYVGKLTTMGQTKGVDVAIASVKRLRVQEHAVELWIVGATQEEMQMPLYQEQDGVHVRGHQPQRELKWMYAAADVLLMPFPDLPHYRSFMSPLKLFEYMASGVPCIATDLPSVREIVGLQEVLLIQPGDVDALVRAILQVMQNPDAAQKRAHASRIMAQRYTWDARAKRLLAMMA